MRTLIKKTLLYKLSILLLFLTTISHAGIFKKKIKGKIIDNVDLIVSQNKKKALKKKSGKEGVYNLAAGEFIHKYVIDANIQDYLIAIKDKLLAGHNFEFEKEVHIYVTYSTDYNAHATSGFNIFIPSIWIHSAQTEDTVAALIAHELSHLILYHPPTSIHRKKQEGAITQFASIAVMGAMLANTKFNNKGGKLNAVMGNNAEVRIRNAILISQLMVEAKTGFINPNLNRKQEEQADFLAVDLLKSAGYNVLGMSEMFKPLVNKEKEDKLVIKKILTLIKASQIEFDNQAKQQLLTGKAENAFNTYLSGWMKTRGKILAFKLTNFIQSKKNTHLLPSIRQDKVGKYNDDNYPKKGKANQNLSTKEFNQKKTKTKFTQIHNLHTKVSEINEQLNARNANKSAKETYAIISKLKKLNRNTVYTMPWVVFGKARLIQGRYKDAVDNLYNHVINNPKVKNIPLDAYTLLAETYIRDKKMDKAQSIIAQGAEQFKGDDSPFQIHKAMMSCLSKDEDAFKKIIEVCIKNPEPSINTRCIELESNIEISKIKNLENENYQWWQGCALEVPFTTVTLSNVERKNKLLAYEKQLKEAARRR